MPEADAVADPNLPDLTMSPPQGLFVETSEDGAHLLRFDSVMNNLGAGDFVVLAELLPEGWVLQQEIPADAGRVSALEVAGALIWGGDGHDHWHVIDAARYWVEPAGGDLGGDVRLDNKVGFCMFDTIPQDATLPGAPAEITHESGGCGTQDSDLLRMGISIGWGDVYRADLEGQYIDISGLPPGEYRILAEVNPDGLFHESDRSNNTAWTDFRRAEPQVAGDAPNLTELEQGTSDTNN